MAPCRGPVFPTGCCLLSHSVGHLGHAPSLRALSFGARPSAETAPRGGRTPGGATALCSQTTQAYQPTTARLPAPHPRRGAILALLEAEPGLCFRELMRRTGIGAGSLDHHVRRLVRAGMVWRVRHGPRILHFATDGPRRVREAVMRHGLDPVDQAILAWSRTAGPRRQLAFLDAPPAQGMPRSSVQHRLGRLVRQGFLHADRKGRSLVYSYIE